MKSRTGRVEPEAEALGNRVLDRACLGEAGTDALLEARDAAEAGIRCHHRDTGRGSGP